MNQRLDRIGWHIVRARHLLDLWFYFEGQDSQDQIIETMQEYDPFFLLTPHAYLVAYVIYMAGVFDETKGTISFPHLVRDLKKTGQLKGQGAAAVDVLLDKAEPIAEKVRTLRNKAFAHRDARISYADVFKMAGVTPPELHDLTDVALKIANRLLLAHRLPVQFFTEFPREAAERMMKALAEKRP